MCCLLPEYNAAALLLKINPVQCLMSFKAYIYFYGDSILRWRVSSSQTAPNRVTAAVIDMPVIRLKTDSQVCLLRDIDSKDPASLNTLATRPLKNASSPNPTISKESDIVALASLPPRLNANMLDGR